MRTVIGWGLLVFMAPCPLRMLAAQEHTTVGGYGEVHYTNPTGPKTPPVVNLARFVVYLAHSFDERLAFRSELEVEDAKIEGGQAGGEVSLEQAYLDYRLGDWITLLTGCASVTGPAPMACRRPRGSGRDARRAGRRASRTRPSRGGSNGRARA